MKIYDSDELYELIENKVVKEIYCDHEDNCDCEPDLLLEGVFLNGKPMYRFTWSLAMNLDYPLEITFE